GQHLTFHLGALRWKCDLRFSHQFKHLCGETGDAAELGMVPLFADLVGLQNTFGQILAVTDGGFGEEIARFAGRWPHGLAVELEASLLGELVHEYADGSGIPLPEW